jgi:hypothetical protein
MASQDSIYQPIIQNIEATIFKGEGTFYIEKEEIKSVFQLTITASEAYISFNVPFWYLKELNNSSFSGNLEDGTICKGLIGGFYNTHDTIAIAACYELTIGEFRPVHTIETVLLGVYFPHSFSFKYNEYEISISASLTDKEIAKRTKRIAGTILEGNRVTVAGENLEIDEVNDFLRDMCLLLRPITSSEVYFGYMKCNNQYIVYYEKRMTGKLFGMRSNMLESTHQYPEYLLRGLQKMETMDKFDRTSIVDIGYSLAASVGCGLLETGLLVLITSLERLGQQASNDKVFNPANYANGLKLLKQVLNNQVTSYFSDSPDLFTIEQQLAIIKSVSRIQPWETAFVQKIKTHLQQNGWSIELDFDKLKELRDSLAHCGIIPSGFAKSEVYKLQEQMEIFLFVHVMDLVGYNGRIKASKDGWAVYPWKEEIKEGIKD